MKSTSKSLGEIFKKPLLIALASSLGLILALLGDGILDELKFKSNKNNSINQQATKS